MQINLNTPGTAATSTIQTVAPAAQAKTTTTTAPSTADTVTLSAEAKAKLASAGFRPDYFEIRRPDDLRRPDPGDTELRIFAAAWLGRARLIDNLAI